MLMEAGGLKRGDARLEDQLQQQIRTQSSRERAMRMVEVQDAASQAPEVLWHRSFDEIVLATFLATEERWEASSLVEKEHKTDTFSKQVNRRVREPSAARWVRCEKGVRAFGESTQTQCGRQK